MNCDDCWSCGLTGHHRRDCRPINQDSAVQVKKDSRAVYNSLYGKSQLEKNKSAKRLENRKMEPLPVKQLSLV